MPKSSSSKPDNRLKKLKYYCGVCQKQCSDANGFRNHENSASHLQNMKLMIAQNPLAYIENSSTKFEEEFEEKAKLYKGTKVKAKIIYESMIKDPNHTHMNTTKWESLTSFLEYLKTTGKFNVELGANPGDGYLLEYIDKEYIELKKELDRKMRQEIDIESKRNEKLIETANLNANLRNLKDEVDREKLNMEEAQNRHYFEELLKKNATGETKTKATSNEEGEIVDEDDGKYRNIDLLEPQDEKSKQKESIKLGFSLGKFLSKDRKKSKKRIRDEIEVQNTTERDVNLDNDNNANDGDNDEKDTTQNNEPLEEETYDKMENQQVKDTSMLTNSLSEEDNQNYHRSTKKQKKSHMSSSEGEDNRKEKKKEKSSRDDGEEEIHTEYWLRPNLIVKILNKNFFPTSEGGTLSLYKKKGVVKKVIDQYIGEIEVLRDDTDQEPLIIRIDQEELETVLPKPQSLSSDNDKGQVLILQGKARGCKGKLISLCEDEFCGNVLVLEGKRKGKLRKIAYEDICKIQKES